MSLIYYEEEADRKRRERQRQAELNRIAWERDEGERRSEQNPYYGKNSSLTPLERAIIEANKQETGLNGSSAWTDRLMSLDRLILQDNTKYPKEMNDPAIQRYVAHHKKNEQELDRGLFTTRPRNWLYGITQDHRHGVMPGYQGMRMRNEMPQQPYFQNSLRDVRYLQQTPPSRWPNNAPIGPPIPEEPEGDRRRRSLSVLSDPTPLRYSRQLVKRALRRLRPGFR